MDISFENLQVLLRHSFTATQQSTFQNELKKALKINEYIIVSDFPENYSFIPQDKALSSHWNNAPATVHPSVIYSKNEDSMLGHTSYVVISDCLSHDKVALHLYQQQLIEFTMRKFQIKPVHMYYFSDEFTVQVSMTGILVSL